VRFMGIENEKLSWGCTYRFIIGGVIYSIGSENENGMLGFGSEDVISSFWSCPSSFIIK
jgi:hypothetical protein